MGEESFYFNPEKKRLIFVTVSSMCLSIRFISILRVKEKGPRFTPHIGLADDTNCPDQLPEG